MGKRKLKHWMLVLAMVATPVALISVGLALVLQRPDGHTRWDRIQSDMGEIRKALNMYAVQHDEYPAALEGLAPAFSGKIPVDPWTKQPLLYTRTATGFEMRCLGKDGVPGGAKPPDLDIVYTESGLVVTP